MRRFLAFAALLAAITPVLAADEIMPGAPKGWLLGGNPENYETGTANLQGMKPGTQVAYIRAGEGADCGTFGALFQTIRADAFRGKRVALSARLRVDGNRNIGNFDAILFARGPGGTTPVARSPYGELQKARRLWEWWPTQVALFVPADATELVLGFRLSGPRTMGWVDQVRFSASRYSGRNFNDQNVLASGWQREEVNEKAFRGSLCGSMRGLLTARNVYGQNERTLLDVRARPVSPEVMLALAGE